LQCGRAKKSTFVPASHLRLFHPTNTRPRSHAFLFGHLRCCSVYERGLDRLLSLFIAFVPKPFAPTRTRTADLSLLTFFLSAVVWGPHLFFATRLIFCCASISRETNTHFAGRLVPPSFPSRLSPYCHPNILYPARSSSILIIHSHALNQQRLCLPPHSLLDFPDYVHIEEDSGVYRQRLHNSNI